MVVHEPRRPDESQAKESSDEDRADRDPFSLPFSCPGSSLLALSSPNGAASPDKPVLIATPPSPSASTSASFGFTGVSGATFECRMDSGLFAACTSPRPYAALPLGAHVFGVRATKAGKTSGETTFAWSVALPGVTVTSRPSDPASSTGATFGFSVSPSNATAACSLDGDPSSL